MPYVHWRTRESKWRCALSC